MVKRLGLASWLLAAVLAGGCGGDDSGGEPSGPYFRFDLPADASVAIPMADLPYPNDALLGADGKIQVTEASLPLHGDADVDLIRTTKEAMARRKGFGVFTGAIFPVGKLASGELLDATTLAGAVSLVALADGAEVPLEITAKPDGNLHVQPRLGNVLVQGKTYAYLIHAGVKTTAGAELVADPDLTALLSSESPGGAAARAGARYAPLRAYLTAHAIDPASIVGATVFTTSEYTPELVAARMILDGRPPAVAMVDHVFHRGEELDGLLGTPADDRFPGSDNPGGVAHADVAAVVLGHFSAVDFTSALPRTLGRWEYDASGAPIVKGMEDIPFFLSLPRSGDLHTVPIMVFNHGFGGSREVVAYLANTMAARGFAMIGIDCPSHGERFSGASDTVHNYTGAAGPDGLADPADQLSQLEFLDVVGDPAHGVTQLDPQAMGAGFRQCAVDIMSEVRLVAGGDWSALAADFPGLGFRGDRIVYGGQSMGGVLGALVTAIDPRIHASVLGVAGGGLLQITTEDSPGLWPTFGTILVGALGVDADQAQPGVHPPHTDLRFILAQTLLEDADPLTYASAIVDAPLDQPKHVALLNAYSDETVPNQSSEALAKAMGLEWMTTRKSSAGPRYIEPVPTKAAPLEGNVTIGGTRITAGWVTLTPASHGMQTSLHAQASYQPTFPPFERRPSAIGILNPITGVQEMTAVFALSYVATGTPRLIDPF